MKSRLNACTDWPQFADRSGYSASSLATALGVSLRHLERYFHDHFQATPQLWLDELRFQSALEMLQNGFLLKEIAIELHFASPSHLCRRFKQRFGCTPRRYAFQSEPAKSTEENSPG